MADPRKLLSAHGGRSCGPASLVFRIPLMVILLALPMDGGVAQTDSSGQDAPLQIRKGFFKATKFVYRGGEPQKVSGFFSYSDAFTDLLARHPASLDEANRAKPYQVTTLLGSVGMLAVSVKMLIETLDDASDVSSGTIDSDTGTTSWTDVGLLAGFGAVMVFSAIKANGHFNRAIDTFNQADAAPGRDDWRPSLDVGLRTLDGRRALALGLSLRW